MSMLLFLFVHMKHGDSQHEVGMPVRLHASESYKLSLDPSIIGEEGEEIFLSCDVTAFICSMLTPSL